MEYGKDDKVVGLKEEENAIREAAEKGAADLSVHDGILFWIAGDPVQAGVQR